MRMLLARLLAFLFLSSLTAYTVELYSFALAHSPAGVLVVLLCPAILVVVFNLLTGSLAWVVVVLLNAIYYELMWRTFRRARGAKSDSETKTK